MSTFQGFIGPSYTSRSGVAADQRCINLYPEKVEANAEKAEYVLYGTPGTSVFCTLPTSPVRGMWSGENRLFAAAGSRFYEIFSGGTYTDRGSIGAGSGPVQIFPNGTQVMVIAGGLVYIDTGVAIVQPTLDTDSTPLAASAGAYLDGYFIIAKPSSKQLYISAINNGLSWDALDTAFKEAYPDSILGFLTDHEDLYVFGSQSMEVWGNTGNADFPLERSAGAMIHSGLGAPATACRLGQGIAFIAYDARGGAVAYRTQGYIPQRISTHALEYTWSLYSTVSDAEAYAYREAGHEFYVVTFPTANATWVYDLTSGLWHQWAYGATLGRHRGRCYAYQYNRNLIGDYATGAIYQMRLDLYDDAGTPIKRVRRAPHLSSELKRTFFSSFTLEQQYGAGLTTTLSWSNDGGSTWNTPQAPSGSIIANGATSKILAQQWRRLGSSRDRQYEVVVTGNAPVALIGAYQEIS